MLNNYEIRGDITAIKLKTTYGIELETIIDTVDLEFVNSFTDYWWYPIYNKGTKSYYVITTRSNYCGKGRNTRTKQLHRALFPGIKRKYVVDHKNHDTLDNRKSHNLREVTSRENRANPKSEEQRNKLKVSFEMIQSEQRKRGRTKKGKTQKQVQVEERVMIKPILVDTLWNSKKNRWEHVYDYVKVKVN